MGNILVGSLPGVLIGTALSPRVPAAALRPALGCVLLGSALGVVTKAGVDIPKWTIVGAPGARRRLAWRPAPACRLRAAVTPTVAEQA